MRAVTSRQQQMAISSIAAPAIAEPMYIVICGADVIGSAAAQFATGQLATGA